MPRSTLPKISKRADGRFWARIEGPPKGGKRTRIAVYGETKKEVADKLVTLLSHQQRGYDITPDQQTIAQFLPMWLEDVVKPNRTPSTYRAYRTMMNAHLIPLLGHVRVSKLTAQQIRRMYVTLAEQGLKAKTIHLIGTVLQSALDVAVEDGVVARNVAKSAKKPSIERFKPDVLTPEMAHRLLLALRGHPHEALFRMALSLGLRHGELLALTWSDVDLDAGRVRVERSIQETVSGIVIGKAAKSQRAQRTLPLPPVLVQLLRAHRIEQNKDRLFYGPQWHTNNLVFPSTMGAVMQPQTVRRMWYALRAHAGLPPTLRVHDLRHACGTFLVAQGVSLRVVMEILGHANIATTANIYAHVFDESVNTAIDTLDSFLEAK